MPEKVKTKAPEKEEKEKVTPAAFLKSHATELTSYLGLALVIILFFATNTNRLMYNLSSVIQSAAVYSVIALGAVFVYSMGFMDISIGQQVGVYVILMILCNNAIGGWPGLIVGMIAVLALALACGALNGSLGVILGLPSVVTSLFLMFFFTGVQMLLIEGTGENTIYLQDVTVRPEDRDMYSVMLVAIIIVVALVATYFFKYTKLGKYTRAIGANETTARQSGVNSIKWRMAGYMALGVCVALGSFVLLTRTGTAGKGTGSGYHMDIMICLILGGMPLKGGMKSKISAALVGSFTYTLLSSVLTTMHVDLNMINFVKAIIFLVIVLMTCRKKDGVLPR